MLVVTDKIIAFKKNGELVIFDSRTDFGSTDIKEAGITLLFASPNDMYRHLLELEETKESIEEVEVDDIDIDDLRMRCGDFVHSSEGGAEEEGEVSENAVRAIRAKEDARQREILERGEDNHVD